MRFAFAIVSLFPGGGLQRDCVDIARRVQALGHEVTIFTSRKSADSFASDIPLRILSVDCVTNHRRQRAFSEQFRQQAAGEFDVLVGFDKLSDLDILYCSDRSMQARASKNPVLRLLPRYWEYIDLERECFGRDRKTKVLLLSESQLNEYWSSWTTEPGRLILLPPTLAKTRSKPGYRTDGTREALRGRLRLAPEDWVWIAVCVQPRTKGIDRTIRALHHFPTAKLMIVGLNETETKSAGIRRLARRVGVADRIQWLGHREDVSELMAAADLFVHPARYDTTGTVILESIANGLPVITTSACGYAKHVSNANAGIVVQDPFHQQTLIAALEAAKDAGCRAVWSKCGADYGKQDQLYEGRGRATELIVSGASQLNAA